MKSAGSHAWRLLIVFVGMLGTGIIGFGLPTFGARLPLPLFPSGIAVAAIYRWGVRVWPAVLAGGIAIDLFTRQPLIAAVGVGFGITGAAVLTLWFLQWFDFDPRFSRAKHVPLFIFAAAFGMTLAPTLGMLGFSLSAAGEPVFHPVIWWRWWSNTTAGVLLIAPILVSASRQSFLQFGASWIESAAWVLGIALVCAAILLLPGGPLPRLYMIMLTLLLVVVGSIRFGVVVAGCGALAIVTATASGFAFGSGIFAQFSEVEGIALIWSFAAALTGMNLTLTALLAERDFVGQERLRAEHRYAQIFDGSPKAIWVHDAETRRFLLVNAAVVRQYGFSREELLSRTVDVLTPPDQSRVVPAPEDVHMTPMAEDAAPEPFETRHMTRDGRVLDIEVWSRPMDLMGRPATLVFAVDVTERMAFGHALVDAVTAEQRRLGQEMHDGLGQELTGLSLSARALANRALRERDSIAGDLEELSLLAASCIKVAHDIVRGLSPLSDADGSLDVALQALVQRTALSGTRVEYRSHRDAHFTLNLKTRNHLYRIAQEALQNSLKHADARQIDIELSARDGVLRLSVLDDGKGMSVDGQNAGGLGMRTMRFRASAIGGRLVMSRPPGGGNSIVCEVPLAKATYDRDAESRTARARGA